MNSVPDYAQWEETPRVSHIRWLSWPVAALGFILPVTILFTVSPEHLGGALLAYLNCVLIVWAILHFIKVDALLGMLLLAALPFLLTAWSVPSLYFALLHLPASYNTLWGRVPHLEGFLRVQGAVFVFLLAYLPPLLIFFHRTRGAEGAPLASPKTLVHLIAVYCIVVTVAYDITRVVMPADAKGGIIWWTWGFYNYSVGLYLVIGALSPFLSHGFRLFLIPFFAVHLVIFAVGNARLPGLLPVLWFCAGYIFLSGVPNKRKGVLLLILFMALPIYVVVGNTTRSVLGKAGFENFGRRFDVLVQGAGQRNVGGMDALTATMGRLFMTGGQNIIARTPEGLPYFEFEPGKYAKEAAESLLPGILYFQPYYRTNWHLMRYGFNIGPTSIEISLLGHFWMMGGWAAVFIGGLATALMHGIVLEIIRRARKISWTKALIYTAFLCTAMFDCFGDDFIGAFRALVWRFMLAVLVYQAIRLVHPDVREEWGEAPALPSSPQAGMSGYQV